MGLLWELEPATAAKHRLYRQYLDAWWPIMLQPTAKGFLRPRVTYVDAFAGPGRYLGGQEGSPVLALDRLLNHVAVDRMRLSRDRVRLVLIEKHRDRYEHLVGELTRRFGSLPDLPVRVEVRHGEAGQVTRPVLDELKAWGQPILAVFDSWGNVNIPLSLVAAIGRNRSSEVITTFGPNWFSRREDQNPELLDMVFGGRQYWEPADRELRSDERWRAWLYAYREALCRAGFPYRLHFQVVPRTGQPLYLIFGTTHERGVEVMKEAMWKVDGSEGMSFRDPRTRGAAPPGQQMLWSAGVVEPELLELVRQRLAQGPTTLDDLRRWLLLETARWRAKDAKTAVAQLLRDGLVDVQPRRRLTSRSYLRLR